MVQRKGGQRRKRASILTKNSRNRGKVSLKSYLMEYKDGEKVTLIVEPAIQKGLYHPRFAGKTGIIKKKLGSCYEVKIKDSNKEKLLVVHPIHMKKA